MAVEPRSYKFVLMTEEMIENILKELSEVLTEQNEQHTLAAEEVEGSAMRLFADYEPLRMN